ncbi:MAG: helix-turn-helix domain-containing protein [candidate division WOR-3 bacterium]
MDNKYEKLFFMVKDSYYQDKLSIRKIALKFNIHYQTVFRWLKRYKSVGKEEFPWCYKRHGRRISTNIENIVIKYKERYPWLTITSTRKMLLKKKIKISCKAIWNIWKRNGYAGFDQKLMGNDFTDFVPLTREARLKLMQAQRYYESGMIKESARILNTIPCLPKNDLILQVPYEKLNLKRRIERLMMQFGTITLSEYLQKAEQVYEECIKNQWNYSALRIGIALCLALSWFGTPERLSKWIKRIERLIPSSIRKARDLFPIYFTMLLSKCHCFVQQLKIRKALDLLRYAYRLVSQQQKPSSNFLYDLAIQYIDVEDYNTAENLLKRAFEGLAEQRKKRAKALLAIYVYLSRCEKKAALNLLKEAEIYDWVRNAQLFRFQSFFALIEGKPLESLSLVQKALNSAKEAGLPLDIANSYLATASVYMCLGEMKKARALINVLRNFTKKIKMNRQLLIANILLQKFPKNKEVLKLSTVNLARLLKNKGYIAGYNYAKKKGVMFYFYRYLFFYPEIVQKRIEKNKPTYLPKTILRLPIFNIKTDVYHINLLGRITIFRNQRYLKVHLLPKDTAILLFIITRINEPEKSLNLNELYKNFWHNNPSPARLFSHSLVRIKKQLKISAHYLEVKRQAGESYMINQNLYFTTDYQEFNETLARAKALQRAGEWGFARKEYLRAFKLFRGEPFKKNFDNWSVDMRFKILSQFETEAINFAKSCIEHGNKTDARKILQKVLKIIPDSEESQRLLETL